VDRQEFRSGDAGIDACAPASPAAPSPQMYRAWVFGTSGCRILYPRTCDS
jgi:hypothetical protein